MLSDVAHAVATKLKSALYSAARYILCYCVWRCSGCLCHVWCCRDVVCVVLKLLSLSLSWCCRGVVVAVSVMCGIVVMCVWC